MNSVLSYLQSILIQERLCPPSDRTEPFRNPPAPNYEAVINLLPTLSKAWNDSATYQRRPSTNPNRSQIQQWLLRQTRNRSQLTWGLPGVAGRRINDWMGDRLIWWPRGIPNKTRVGIVSSRLARPVEESCAWFSVLRKICLEMDCQDEVLLAAQRTSPAEYVQRCSERFGVDLLLFEFGSSGRSWKTWFDSCVSRTDDSASAHPHIWPAFVSPARDHCSAISAPERDQIVVAAANRLVALRVRQRGNIQQLLTRGLTQQRHRIGKLTVAVGAKLTSASAADNLKELGASVLAVTESWPGDLHIPKALPTPVAIRSTDPPAKRSKSAQPVSYLLNAGNHVTPLPVIMNPEDFLTHYTRQQNGPWPDQTRDQYLDHLILGHAESDHSAFASLRRIVSSQLLVATGKTIRRRTKVVSFTAVPLREIGQLRTFRPHRGRWDFEPYGIAIRREWLKDRDTRPVHYLDTSGWERLSSDERPFFQVKTSGKHNEIDWSVECEWRHVGDLDLQRLPNDAAWVLVPSWEEAEQLAAASRWPVLVVGRGWKQG